MNKIYDNGEILLGKVKDIIEYTKKQEIIDEEMEEILQDLKDFEDNTIVAINYDNGMGYTIDYWDESFIDDEEKYIDFLNLSKEEFLKMYSYVTEEEYNNTMIDWVNDTLERYTDDEIGDWGKEDFQAMTNEQKIILFENAKMMTDDTDDIDTNIAINFDYGNYNEKGDIQLPF